MFGKSYLKEMLPKELQDMGRDFLKFYQQLGLLILMKVQVLKEIA
jgi:hypothetical protein